MQHLAELAVEGGNVYPYLNTKKTPKQEKQCSKGSSPSHLQILLQNKKKIASHALQTLVNLA